MLDPKKLRENFDEINNNLNKEIFQLIKKNLYQLMKIEEV